MTSDDTHARTAALLEANGHFGAARDQITLIKQEKVACLADGDARLALEPKDPFAVQVTTMTTMMMMMGALLMCVWAGIGLGVFV